jgi:hypothetical protein
LILLVGTKARSKLEKKKRVETGSLIKTAPDSLMDSGEADVQDKLTLNFLHCKRDHWKKDYFYSSGLRIASRSHPEGCITNCSLSISRLGVMIQVGK